MEFNNEDFALAMETISFFAKKYENDEMVATLVDSGLDKDAAVKYVLFIPVAFFRLMLPKFRFPETYSVINGKDIKFADNPFYLSLFHACSDLFSERLNPDFILKIASRSSEFKAVNHLLLKGGKLDEIELTPMMIIP